MTALTDKHTSRISIQVGLSGYSFVMEIDGEVSCCLMQTPDRVFTSSELQRRYDVVEIGVFTPKFALVPAHFHSPETSRELLSDVVSLDDSDPVSYADVPGTGAVLVYSNRIGATLPQVLSNTVLHTDGTPAVCLPFIYYMLRSLSGMQEYNKIVAACSDGYLYLVIAQGRTLLLCNSFRSPDFTTAEYFIFLAMKKLQLNPEMSSITFRTPLEAEEEMSLYRYFRNVEVSNELF